MAFNIVSWNIEENQDWYVKLSDSGSGILIQIYDSLVKATAGTDLRAYGTTQGYGTNYVVLSAGGGYSETLGFFQDIYNWHLRVSGSAGNPTIIKKVAKFVEMSPISDAIYKNEDIITTRGTKEIREHTNAEYTNRLVIAEWNDLDIGDIVTIDSDRITSELTQLTSITIRATTTSLLFDCNLTDFEEIRKS